MEKATKKDLPSHYVGIGASAGGLEALQTLLSQLPENTGAAFVIVQHLSPDFKSMMLELLSKHTKMEIQNVQDVEDGIQVLANTIYLIPPKKNMQMARGRLLLTDKIPESGLNLPIDIFFRSLSEDQQHKAVGIVLSGTGSDGSRGVKSLKEAGALIIAQSPESAKFDGMPNSAISTGMVDMVLHPEDIGEKLSAYISHPLAQDKTEVIKERMVDNQDLMNEIFTVLKAKSEIDFSKYKPSTVARRIERRMTIKQIGTLQEYLTLLFKEPYEVQVLSKELLIGVTRFFRDDEAFEILREKIIPEIVKNSTEKDPIRVWSAGCSTGEEAYSYAILFADEIERQKLNRTVKVFATDVNPDAINEASVGVYGDDIQHDVGSDILTRHFSKQTSQTFQVNKNIRQMVIFATHNMISDPPFSNMDFVSCRNILIYFQHSVQKRVLASLHFSLCKDGFLFLGSSENLSELAPHFETISDRTRLFKKRSSVRIPMGASPSMNSVSQTSGQTMPSVSRLLRGYRGNSTSGAPASFASEKLISKYAPPCVLLNDEQEAIHVYGNVENFIKRVPPGRISNDIKDMVNDDIAIAVSSALHRARQSLEEVYYTGVYTQVGNEQIALNIRAFYMKEHDIESSPGFYWLVFEQKDMNENASSVTQISFDAAEQARQRIEDLETELKQSREHLQVTVEELETTNEELQSANEELMSANEELQSTNEELQSVNEELYTVNSEYQEKIAEISQTNSDLDEVLSLSNIGIVFLDENLLIRRYTHAASKYINLLETDVNRPLHHISQNIEYDEMLADVSKVVSTGGTVVKEIVTRDKRVLQISINSYAYSDVAESKGVALTFSDVSKAKYTEKGLAVAYKELRRSVNNALAALGNVELSKKVSVLVLDDESASQIVIENHLMLLNDLVDKVFVASTISEAMDIYQRESIGACIVDFHLDGETAVDFAECFDERENRPPILVVTGRADKKLNPLLFSHGLLDLLQKDEIDIDSLGRSLRFAVRRNEIDLNVSQDLQSDL